MVVIKNNKLTTSGLLALIKIHSSFHMSDFNAAKTSSFMTVFITNAMFLNSSGPFLVTNNVRGNKSPKGLLQNINGTLQTNNEERGPNKNFIYPFYVQPRPSSWRDVTQVIRRTCGGFYDMNKSVFRKLTSLDVS